MWNRRLFPLWFFALLIAAIWGLLTVGYVVSVVIHPRTRCTHCGGSGELRGSIFPWTFRRCPQCAGGRTIRRGAAVIGLPHVKAQARQQRETRQNTRTRQRW